MSAGLYKLNNNVSYTLNLEKKLKRKKEATIIQTYFGTETDPDLLEKILLKMLDEYNKRNVNVNDEVNCSERYVFINPKTKETIISIYDNLDNLKMNLNVNEWILNKSM